MRGAFLISLLLSSLAAHAHDADIIYAQLQRAPDSQEVHELLTMTASTLLLLAPVDPDRDGLVTEEELGSRAESIRAGIWVSLPIEAGGVPCTLKSHQARLRESYVELRGVFECGEGELVQTFRLLSILPTTYKVVLGTFLNGEAGARFAQGNAQTLVLDEPAGEQVSGLSGWLFLGVDHIFRGPDHLAFIFALLLAATGLKRVLLMVTSFTIAHSLTLGLTAAGIIPLSSDHARWVEVAIAVSILWVAVENLFLKDPKHRAALTFAFGLLHGFGFASSLRGYGIERELVTALFGFNLGVELGQGAVVLAVAPMLFVVRARPRTWAVFSKLASLSIIGAGGYWVVTRLGG